MTTRAAATRARLQIAALTVVQEKGLAATSARTIAAAAKTNQALIFYHYGSVSELIEAASDEAVRTRIELYGAEFAEVATLQQLLTVGRAVHERERAAGTVTVMAQLMAGAPNDTVLARATRHAISAWTEQVEQVLHRVFATSPLGNLIDSTGLAHLITATFVGMELVQGADLDAADRAFASIEQLNELVTRLDALGPVPKKAVQMALRRGKK